MPQTPMIRVALLPRSGRAVMWNDFGLFEGRYVPRDILLMERGKKSLTIHLDSIEDLKSPDEAFAPAANAKGPITGPIEGPAGIAYPVHLEPPLYPLLARSTHIQGDVTMKVTVGKDGSVTDVKVLDGPGILRPGTVEAVRKWRYEPMLIMGDRVEMNLKVVVNFNMGNGPVRSR
jgi:TonB family protein